MKTLLASQEHVNPPLFTSLKQAMRPLMSKHRLDGGDGEGGGEAEDDFE